MLLVKSWEKPRSAKRLKNIQALLNYKTMKTATFYVCAVMNDSCNWNYYFMNAGESKSFWRLILCFSLTDICSTAISVIKLFNRYDRVFYLLRSKMQLKIDYTYNRIYILIGHTIIVMSISTFKRYLFTGQNYSADIIIHWIKLFTG